VDNQSVRIIPAWYHLILSTTVFLPIQVKASTLPCTSTEVRISSSWVNIGRVPDENQPKPSDLVELPRELSLNRERIALEKNSYIALLEMLAKAEKDGIYLRVASGFRSNRTQKKIIESRLKGHEYLDDIYRSIAPVGYSTHLTGKAVDFASVEQPFESTSAYEWLKINSNNFGFKETYYKNNPYGISWEPWHYDFTSR